MCAGKKQKPNYRNERPDDKTLRDCPEGLPETVVCFNTTNHDGCMACTKSTKLNRN